MPECVDPDVPHEHCPLHGCVEYVCCIPKEKSVSWSVVYVDHGGVLKLGEFRRMTGETRDQLVSRFERDECVKVVSAVPALRGAPWWRQRCEALPLLWRASARK